MPPLSFAEALDDVPNPAPADTRNDHLRCEQEKDIRAAKTLVSDITADATGELFIYVNDAVVAVPRWARFFYRNNGGSMNVTVTRILAPWAIDSDGAATPKGVR